jgi:hypothetical protein
MIQQLEIWRVTRLKLLDDMQSTNEVSVALRGIRIGNKKIFITSDEMREVIKLLKRTTAQKTESVNPVEND